MVFVAELISIFPFLFRIPITGSGEGGFFEWDDVTDVQFGGIGEGPVGVGGVPFPVAHCAFFVGLEGNRDEAFLDEDFLIGNSTNRSG